MTRSSDVSEPVPAHGEDATSGFVDGSENLVRDVRDRRRIERLVFDEQDAWELVTGEFREEIVVVREDRTAGFERVVGDPFVRTPLVETETKSTCFTSCP